MSEYHIKVRSLAKGYFTFEVDVSGQDMAETLKESDDLVKELCQRYPLLVPSDLQNRAKISKVDAKKA